MTHERILKLRGLIQERIPASVVVLDPVKHVYNNMPNPSIKYKSVTTKLKVISNPIWAEWRVNRVIEFVEQNPFDETKETFKEYLQRAKNYPEELFRAAGDRGTKVHDYADKYFKKWILEDKQPDNITSFVQQEKDATIWSAVRSIEAWVKKTDYIPLASELTLWHDKEELAGTMDNIGIIGNEIVVVDWKTSNQLREDYELQLSCYAQMFYLLARFKPKRGIIVKADKEHGQSKDFDEILDLKQRYKTYKVASKLYDDMQDLRDLRKFIKQNKVIKI
jgi:hypothetical protein